MSFRKFGATPTPSLADFRRARTPRSCLCEILRYEICAWCFAKAWILLSERVLIIRANINRTSPTWRRLIELFTSMSFIRLGARNLEVRNIWSVFCRKWSSVHFLALLQLPLLLEAPCSRSWKSWKVLLQVLEGRCGRGGGRGGHPNMTHSEGAMFHFWHSLFRWVAVVFILLPGIGIRGGPSLGARRSLSSLKGTYFQLKS